MSRLDIVIFGATGFTGMKTVEEIVKMVKKNINLTWGVAGRSQNKLDDLMVKLSKKTGEDLSNIKKIIADVGDEKSLKEMCSQCKVLVNCCGPYRLYGEPVVKAAVESKTNYVDVSGEPQFMETMELRYGDLAREAGVYVVSACGFDSIPNDLGVVFMQKNFNGTLNSVESYISTWLSPSHKKQAMKDGFMHTGTWESLIYGIAHSSDLRAFRKSLNKTPLPHFKPRLQSRGTLHRTGADWCLPFPGADASVVHRTQRRRYEEEHARPVQFKVYAKFGGILNVLLVGLVATVFSFMAKFAFTRNLLLTHPRFFSCGVFTSGEISDEVMDNTHYEFTLHGEGWASGTDVDAAKPNKRMVVKVWGTNPGYGMTVVALLSSALTILNEKDAMPATGGVLTTGAAFANTSLVHKLKENNVAFDIVADELLK